MIPKEYPVPQIKTDSVKAVLNSVAQRKADEEKAALQIAYSAEKDGLYRLMKAISKTERLVAEHTLKLMPKIINHIIN